MPDFDLDDPRVLRGLRADLLTPTVTLSDHEPVVVRVKVRNTSSVIETVDVRLRELLAESVVQTPTEVTLFPDEATEVELTVRLGDDLPAGSHHGLIEVTGRSKTTLPTELDLTVEVPAAPALALELEPPVRRAGSHGAFDLFVRNSGNTRAELLLTAVDANRQLELALGQRKLNVNPGESRLVTLDARGKRPWTGAPLEHVITVTAEGGPVEQAAEARFVQRPRLTAGVITLLTLGLIVLLWAVAMLFGVTQALEPPAPTKIAPAAFTQGLGTEDLDPAVSGGSAVGQVVAVSTGEGVPRVSVEVYGNDGTLVTATATGDDGTYELGGLLPSRYRLHYRAEGFQDVWWPGTPDAAGAGVLSIGAGEPADAGQVSLTGLPASVGGAVVDADGQPVTATVLVTPVDVAGDPAPVATTTDAQGVWSVAGLTAPASYEIQYDAEGFATVTTTEAIAAGEQLTVNTVRMPTAAGAIAGTVREVGGAPIGNAEVVLQNGTDEFTITTPTAGEVGTFDFDDLPTPDTYLVIASAEGFATETQAVRLDPGQSLDGVEVVLASSSGTVTGRITTATGAPLGGATITVSGGDVSVSTESLTSGDLGTFRVTGLPVDRSYTVTADLEGYGRQTRQVVLTSDVTTAQADLVLTATTGRISGIVVDRGSGDPVAGAEVEISDGATPRTTTTTSAPADQVGRFNLGGLTPGSYTITVTTPDGHTLTVLEDVRPGQTTEVRMEVGAA